MPREVALPLTEPVGLPADEMAHMLTKPRSVDELLREMRVHSDRFARQNARKVNSSPSIALVRGMWAFLKSYVFEFGFVHGHRGLVASAFKSQTIFWQFLRLSEANCREPSNTRLP